MDIFGLILYVLIFIVIVFLICLIVIMFKRYQAVMQYKAKMLNHMPEDLYGCPKPEDNPIEEDNPIKEDKN